METIVTFDDFADAKHFRSIVDGTYLKGKAQVGGTSATIYAGALSRLHSVATGLFQRSTVDFGSPIRGAQWVIFHEWGHSRGLPATPRGELAADRFACGFVSC